jgi:hypothetical protein
MPVKHTACGFFITATANHFKGRVKPMTIKRTRGKEVLECSTLDKNKQGRKQSVETIQNGNTKKLSAKDRVKIKILEFLANSENGFIPWQRLCTEVCHYKNSRYLYNLFTIEERHEILQTALAERRKNYARQGIILH